MPSGESISEDLMDLSEIKHNFCTENVQEYNKEWQQCRNKVKNLRVQQFHQRAQQHPWTQAVEEPVNIEEKEANVNNKMYKILLYIPVASLSIDIDAVRSMCTSE